MHGDKRCSRVSSMLTASLYRKQYIRGVGKSSSKWRHGPRRQTTPLRPRSGDVVSVAAGGYFDVALKFDGRLVGWGDNSWGQLSGLSQLSNIVAVAADYAHVLALRADGTVYARGGNFSGQINVPAGLDDVIAIAAGWESSMALRSDGSLVQWGPGQKVSGADGLHDIVAIAPGLALREDGSLLGWFDESPGAPAIVAISGSRDRRLLLRADGTVSPADSLAGLSNVVGMAAGFLHSLALVGGGPPRIIQQPLGFTAASGRNARLVVSASGTQPMRYQWRQNGSGIVGATRPVLALDNLSILRRSGLRRHRVKRLGSSTSRVATISVTFQPLRR